MKKQQAETKARQQKIADMKRIKAAYEEAKVKGLVRSRPITLDEKPKLEE